MDNGDDEDLFDTTRGLSPTDLVSVKGLNVLREDLIRRIKDATPEWLDELEEACITFGAASILLLIQTERRSRTESGLRVIAEMRHSEIIDRLKVLEKPHWTTTPGFWVAVGGLLFAALAAWLSWLALRPPPREAGSLPASSLSTPTPAAQTPPTK